MKKFYFIIFSIFGLIVLGLFLSEQIAFRYHYWRLQSDYQPTRMKSAEALLQKGKVGSDEVYKRYRRIYFVGDGIRVENSESAARKRTDVVDELCGLGDEGKAVMYRIFRERCIYEMVRIDEGSFMMGSKYGEYDEKPVHEVKLSGFWMDRFEVTNERYYVFVKVTGHEDPQEWDGSSIWQEGQVPEGLLIQPVVLVSWKDAYTYAKWLKMSLPTEAQWEYACRVGSTGKYCFGDDESMLGDYAWYDSNSRGGTNPVGQKKPNRWGLFDMHGNVWEWCQDWYDEDYYSKSPTEDPQGPASGSFRVIRGGSWGNYGSACRSANRYYGTTETTLNTIGFRVCRASAP